MRDANQLTPYEITLGSRLTNEQAIAEIIKRLYQNLESLYPDIDKSKAIIRGYSLGGLFAHTFRFTLTHNEKSIGIFAKICPVYESLDPARVEFDTLETVYSKMKAATDMYAVSRPLIYFKDMNCYAMESVGVKDLRSVLLKNNTVFAGSQAINELNYYMKGSAEWLAMFHEITANGISQKFEMKSFLNSFTDEFNYADLAQYSFSSNMLNAIDMVFHKLSSSELNVTMPLAGWHWDYTPGHVYLDNNRISVIDILGVDNTPVYEDIGHFLASITSINNLPKYLLFNRRRSATEFCNVFIDSYFKRTALDNNEFILLTNIYRLKHLVIYFIIQNRQISGKLGTTAGALYSNTRGVRLFEKPILHSLSEISRLINV